MADLGLAYVRFALQHRAHFEVMFRPDLYDADNPSVAEPRDRARASLRRTAQLADTYTATAPPEAAELAAWALVHGFATLLTTRTAELSSPVTSTSSSGKPQR